MALISKKEIQLEKLRLRYQFAGTIIGTAVVSVFSSWLIFAEKTQQNDQNFDSQHRDFVAQFVDQAIDKDIEKRQRLARYFATVTLNKVQRDLWDVNGGAILGRSSGGKMRSRAV